MAARLEQRGQVVDGEVGGDVGDMIVSIRNCEMVERFACCVAG